MFKKFILITSLFFPSILFAQVKNTEFREFLNSNYTHSVPLITIDSLKHLKGAYILDARESEEFEVSHLKHARNVGYIWFDMRNIYDIPKNATIVVYCSLGTRSEKIGEKLIRFGYKNIFNLSGGIFEWVNEGNPVYKSSGVQTTEIHTHTEKWAVWVNRGTKVF